MSADSLVLAQRVGSTASQLEVSCEPTSVDQRLKSIVQLFMQRADDQAYLQFDTELPQEIKNSIYGKIWRMKGSPTKETQPNIAHPSFGRLVFFDRHAKCSVSHLEKVHAIHSYIRESEFEKSTLEMRDFEKAEYESSSRVGRLEQNLPLNRFKHIIPFDETLVPLKGGYINASLVFGGKYILTQYPLKHTIDAFWQMVDERGSQVIVMLNEKHEDASGIYWPTELNGVKKCGSRSIQLLEEKQIVVPSENAASSSIIVCRKLKLSSEGNEDRIVIQVHCTNWKDDTSGDVNCLHQIMLLASRFQGGSEAPIVVHCKGGVGRTGVFAVVHHVATEAESGRDIDIQKAFTDLRNPKTGRWHLMVTTPQQYLTCYQVLAKNSSLSKEAAKKPDPESNNQKLLKLDEAIETIKSVHPRGKRRQKLHELFDELKIDKKIKYAAYDEIGRKAGKPSQEQRDFGRAHFGDSLSGLQHILRSIAAFSL